MPNSLESFILYVCVPLILAITGIGAIIAWAFHADVSRIAVASFVISVAVNVIILLYLRMMD